LEYFRELTRWRKPEKQALTADELVAQRLLHAMHACVEKVQDASAYSVVKADDFSRIFSSAPLMN